MRKALSLILAMLPAMVFAQTFEVKYNLSDFTINHLSDELIEIDSDLNYIYDINEGLPELPLFPINILCSNGAVECTPNVSIQKQVIETNVSLNAILPYYIASEDSTYSGQATTVSYLNSYKYSGIQKQNGYSIASFILSPFLYDYDTRTLYFIESFVITLNEVIQPSTRSDESEYTRDGVTESIQEFVINPTHIESSYPGTRSTGRETLRPQPRKGRNYLIITSNSLKKSFERLQQWRTLINQMNVSIITVEEIYNSYSESTPQLKIKRCIQDYYLNHNVGYVLLGGDAVNVQVQKCYTYLKARDGNVSEHFECDLFYACFDGAFD